MVHQKQFAVCCFIKEDEVGGTWNFFWRVIIEGLVEGLCEESGGKELCLELVDIYQVAYLSPLSSLSGSELWPWPMAI